MSTLRNPVGPQPASVYWRRRLVVGLGLLAVIVVVILIVVRPGSGTPAPTPSPSSSSSSAANTASNPPPAAGDAVACDPTKITVDPVTDATEFQAGVNPQLWFTVKSTMTEPCVLAAGSDLQVYTITSGEEVIWTSTDCQTGAEPAEVILQPGVPKEGAHLTWDRTRSSPDTCDTPGEAVTGGGASYHLGVAIGDIESAETRQFLLY